jgi:hypothetical protein
MAIYRANDLAHYASKQVATATLTLAEHRLDELGLCRGCGWIHPCTDARQAYWQVNHYLPYVQTPKLVRPYVPDIERPGSFLDSGSRVPPEPARQARLPRQGAGAAQVTTRREE